MGSLWGKHTGMCLEFDNLIPEALRFNDSINIIIEGTIQYNFNNLANYCQDKKLGMIRLFLSKSNQYSYEKEYRIISNSPDSIIRFNPPFITKVIFGLRTTLAEQTRVVKLCDTPLLFHIRFEVAEQQNGKLAYRQWQ